MALDQGVIDAVTNANFKLNAEMATQNAVSHQNRLNMIAESSVGQILNRMNGLDPTEAAAIRGVVGADLSKTIGDLGAAVAGLQQMLKGAQTTPPVTP